MVDFAGEKLMADLLKLLCKHLRSCMPHACFCIIIRQKILESC